MGEALYRKHRPYTLDEIKGQEHITKTLKNALKNDHISHAYLFTGPRGTGKTSIARILAHKINNLEYDSKSPKNHIDIIEIDAASNRRIDEIRDLREKARISPANAKYKVYIIDEAHMLTKEAFNALLKTLEEPPSHVVFILATTEAHKLPDTIISRTQRFSFKSISTKDLVDQLQSIAKKEKIKINKQAVELIAKHGKGSFRDSTSLLDQIRSGDKEISIDLVKESIGYAPDTLINHLLDSVKNGDIKKIFTHLEEASSQGIDCINISNSLMEKIRNSLLSNDYTNSLDTYLWLIDHLIEIPKSFDPESKLEVVLAEAANKNKPDGDSLLSSEANDEKLKINAIPNSKKSLSTKMVTNQIDTNDLWNKILVSMRGKYNTLYGIARMAEVDFIDDTLELKFKHEFHKKRCGEEKNLTIIKQIASSLGYPNIKLNITKDNNLKEPNIDNDTSQKGATSDTLESVTSVFGGGEILED